MSQTISAIASLLWPLLVLAALLAFRGPLSRVIRSTEQRDFTIRIGGEEVSVGQLSRQQMDLTADLHEQLAALRKQVEELTPGTGTVVTKAAPAADPEAEAGPGSPNGLRAVDPDTELADVAVPIQQRSMLSVDAGKPPWERLGAPAQEADEADAPRLPGAGPGTEDGAEPGGFGATAALSSPAGLGSPAGPGAAHGPRGRGWPDTRPKPAGVLWVDDHPENNALQLDQLERKGVMVDTARSTREALQKLTGQRYQIIVSDMERVEDGKQVPDAGLELLRTVRAFDRETPVAVYSSGPMAKLYGESAEKSGASLVTGSWYRLAEELRDIGLL